MKDHFLLLIFIGVFFSSAFAQPGNPVLLENYLRQNNITTLSAADGLHYSVQREGSGVSPGEGDYVLIQYKAMLLDSTVFDESEAGNPFIFQAGNREVIKGLDQGIRLMKMGGKNTFYIPASMGYKQYGIEGSVPPDSPLMYEVELLDVMDFDQYDRYMRELEERERAAFEYNKKAQFNTDIRLIDDYIATKQLRTRRTPSGLSYVISKPGKGATAKKGNQLKINYEGYFLDGNPFDASEKPFEFTLGAAKVIEGWEEGLQFFSKGSEGWLLIPSKLAYGPVSVGKIPENSVLVFKIQVLDIR